MLNRLKIKRWKKYTEANVAHGNNFIVNYPINWGGEPYLLSFGNNVVISCDVSFVCHDGSTYLLNWLSEYGLKNVEKIAPIIVGDNVFIGIGVTILQGVHIGDKVIVGAGSLVCKDIPSNSVAAGVPAKVICSFDEWVEKNKRNFESNLRMDYIDKKRFYLNKYKK